MTRHNDTGSARRKFTRTRAQLDRARKRYVGLVVAPLLRAATSDAERDSILDRAEIRAYETGLYSVNTTGVRTALLWKYARLVNGGRARWGRTWLDGDGWEYDYNRRYPLRRRPGCWISVKFERRKAKTA